MALTFRAFFQGLSQSAPAIVNTIYQYRQDEINRSFQERQMSLEERKAAQYGEYMGAATEQARAGTEEQRLTNEQLRKTIPLDVAIKESQKKTAEYVQSLQDADKDAKIGRYGSLAGAVEKDLLSKEQAASDAHTIALQQLKTLEAQEGTATFTKHIMTLKYEEERNEAVFAFGQLYHRLAKDPKTQAAFDKMLAENSTENGGPNIQGMREFVANHVGDFFAPETAAIADRALGVLDKAAEINMKLRANYDTLFEEAQVSPDKKVRNKVEELLLAYSPGVEKNMLHSINPNDPDKRTYAQIAKTKIIDTKYPQDIMTMRALRVYEPISRITSGWDFAAEPVADVATQPAPTGQPMKKKTGFDPAGMAIPPISKAFKKITRPSPYPEY